MWIAPCDIRFTHDSISSVFSCGRYIYDTYDELKRGFKSHRDIPTMMISYMDGEWYTYTGNRRLWVFQRLQRKGYLQEICVDTTDRVLPWSRFTTRNNGVSVTVRGQASARLPSSTSTPKQKDTEPRNVACPVCGVTRFKNGTGAVMHVESGRCPGCPGADNARRQIYDFARGNGQTRSLLTPMLMDRPSSAVDVGDKLYQCKRCQKTFRQMSQLMQHTKDKHDNEPPRLAISGAGAWVF